MEELKSSPVIIPSPKELVEKLKLIASQYSTPLIVDWNAGILSSITDVQLEIIRNKHEK